MKTQGSDIYHKVDKVKHSVHLRSRIPENQKMKSVGVPFKEYESSRLPGINAI
jgi:hypothetical protein